MASLKISSPVPEVKSSTTALVHNADGSLPQKWWLFSRMPFGSIHFLIHSAALQSEGQSTSIASQVVLVSFEIPNVKDVVDGVGSCYSQRNPPQISRQW